jgi:hypothetical protein
MLGQYILFNILIKIKEFFSQKHYLLVKGKYAFKNSKLGK